MVVLRLKGLLSILVLLATIAPISVTAEAIQGTTLDATKVAPPTNQRLRPNIKYIESKSDLVDNTDRTVVDNLPPCPPPDGIKDCPDLNGGGRTATTDATCPNVCLVMKVDVPAKSKVVAGVTIYTKSGDYEKEAFCPPTYSAIGLAKSMPDQSYTKPGPAIKDINSKAVYDAAEANNYTCHADGKPRWTPPPIIGLLGTPNRYCPGHILQTYPKADDIIKDAGLGTNNYVVITKYEADPSKSTCQAAGGGPSGNLCDPCTGPASQLNYQAFYQQLQCDAPEGWYPTNTQSPHATICTRTRSEWKSLRD